ncbi:MAG: carboxypeptidase-like regulatory domain-containing protein [Paludibacter sp.]
MKTKNNQSKNVLLLMAMVLISSGIFAETTYSVSGRILNSKRHPAKFATATLLNSTSMEIIGTAVCDGKGEFHIDNVEGGAYYLSINKFGSSNSVCRKIFIDENKTIIETTSIILSQIKNETNQSVDSSKIQLVD